MILAWYYVIVREDSSAIRESRMALTLDPSSYPIVANVVSILRAAGRFDLATIEARRYLQPEIHQPRVMHGSLSWDLLLLGKTAAAKIQLDSALAINAECCKRTRALYYALTGDLQRSNKMLDEFITSKNESGTYYRADWIAEVTAANGDDDRTFKLLDQAYDDRSVGLPVFPRNVLLTRFKDDARFIALAKKLGVAP